jgi:hypothetical protein
VSAIASLPFKVAHRLNKIRAQARNPTRSVDYAGRTPSIDRALFDVPSHSITTDAAWFMHDYVVEHGLRLGLEIGSKFGWSGMWLSRALAANGGELVQADLKLRARLGANYRVAGVANATIVLGDSSSAEVAAAVGGVLRGRALDFAFIDGDHSYEACLADYRLVERYSGPETHVFFDNMWECGGVLRVFEEQPADDKLIVRGCVPTPRAGATRSASVSTCCGTGRPTPRHPSSSCRHRGVLTWSPRAARSSMAPLGRAADPPAAPASREAHHAHERRLRLHSSFLSAAGSAVPAVVQPDGPVAAGAVFVNGKNPRSLPCVA